MTDTCQHRDDGRGRCIDCDGFTDTYDRGPIDILIAEYAAWNKAQGLNLGSADEHVWDDDLTDAQRAWLRNFVRLWDDAATLERAWAEAERQAFLS